MVVIGVESTIGTGSVFWFELLTTVEDQRAIGDVEPQPAVTANVQDPARERLLLYVEDNPANVRLVERIIARHPALRLMIAVTGSSGIELARASQPEVILLDINLPDISGIEVLGVLREDPATAHIPVVAISANAMAHDIEKGLQAGFFRYLTKPIKVDELMSTLNEVLQIADERVAP